MRNEYKIGKVTFGSVGRKWKFAWKRGRWGRTLLVELRGKETAVKVANIINGSLKRGGLDNMARANIAKVTAKPAGELNPIVY